jgi:hypothetical protein
MRGLRDNCCVFFSPAEIDGSHQNTRQTFVQLEKWITTVEQLD